MVGEKGRERGAHLPVEAAASMAAGPPPCPLPVREEEASSCRRVSLLRVPMSPQALMACCQRS
jgi:hypothetical protein